MPLAAPELSRRRPSLAPEGEFRELGGMQPTEQAAFDDAYGGITQKPRPGSRSTTTCCGRTAMASAKSSGRTCTAPDTSTPRVHRTGARLFPSASPPHALRRNGRETCPSTLVWLRPPARTLATQRMNRSVSQATAIPARPHPKPAFRAGLGNAVPSLHADVTPPDNVVATPRPRAH